MSDQLPGVVIDALTDTFEIYVDEKAASFLGELFGSGVQEVVKNVPLLKWGYVAAAAINSATSAMEARRLLALYRTIKNQQQDIVNYLSKLSNSESLRLREIILEQVSKQSHEKQSEALGWLLISLAQGKIESGLFDGLVAELTRVNPLAYQKPALYMLRSSLKDHHVLEGPRHYLPAAFITNGTEKLAFITQDVLTDLGEAFFKFVYPRMVS